MTMKRRVVYMDDSTWEALREHAASQATSISEHLRRAVTGDGRLAESLALAQAGERAGASARADKAAHDRMVGFARTTGRRGVPEIDAAIDAGELGEVPPFLKTAVDATIAAVRRRTATRITGHDAFAELRPAPKPVRPRRPRP